MVCVCVALAGLLTHLCLHHLHPLFSEVSDDGREVHCVFPTGLLEGDVQGNERPCTSHTSTAGGVGVGEIPLHHHPIQKVVLVMYRASLLMGAR